MITVEQIILIGGSLFGGGVLGTIVASFNTKKIGMKGNENEARRDIDSAWNLITGNLQKQLDDVKKDIASQKVELDDTRKAQKRGDRLNTLLVGHMITLERLVPHPPGPPARPEEIIDFLNEKGLE